MWLSATRSIAYGIGESARGVCGHTEALTRNARLAPMTRGRSACTDVGAWEQKRAFGERIDTIMLTCLARILLVLISMRLPPW